MEKNLQRKVEEGNEDLEKRENYKKTKMKRKTPERERGRVGYWGM